MSVAWAGISVCVLGASAEALEWSRDFDDNTVQGLLEFDLADYFLGIDEFQACGNNGNLRLKFNGITDLIANGDTGFMYEPTVFHDVSAKVLIRYSTNPAFPDEEYNPVMNGGMIIRFTEQHGGYVLVNNDGNYLQLFKVGGGITSIDQIGGETDNVPGFNPIYDWWMRFQANSLPNGTVELKGRMWKDGELEPECLWQVQAMDANNPALSGIAGILANEDVNGQWIEFDDAHMTDQLICVEQCGNGVDDDQDSDIDCADPDCSTTLACICKQPFADLDADGDVDQIDFAAFQRCVTGDQDPGQSYDPQSCECLDRDLDEDVDLDDLASFRACFSGPSVPANSECNE